MSTWVFVFILAAIVALVAFLKRGTAGPRNYVLKAETGVFEAIDKFWGLAPGTVEKSKPLVVAGHAADNALDAVIPIAKPLVPVVPGLGAVVTVAEAADKSLEAALAGAKPGVQSASPPATPPPTPAAPAGAPFPYTAIAPGTPV